LLFFIEDVGRRKRSVGLAPWPSGRTAAKRPTAARRRAYLAAITADLAAIARSHGLDVLGYLLDMATVEAENVSRHADRHE
jgi:hypothetical protein